MMATNSNPLATDLDHVLDHTRELWDELRGERLFITGGTGFIGCWLLESLLWANKELRLGACATVLTRDPSAFASKAPHLAADEAVTLLAGSFRSFAWPAGSFTHILHVATETAPDGSPVKPLDLYNSNTEGTLRVMELAQRCAAAKLLFTSSGAVYGRQPASLTHIPEDFYGAPATTEPATAYGQSKRASEFLLAASATSNLHAKIARCFAFVGPGLPLDANYAIGNFIRDALAGRCIQVNGDGTPHRSYLYAADLAIWLWTILFQGEHGRPYNVGSDEDLTIGELARLVADELAPGIEIQVAKESVPGQPVQRYVPSTARAREELGLQAWIPLAEGIRRTAQFHLR